MNSKDKDLEKLLQPLKELNPNDLQMQQWQRAIKSQLPQPKASFNMKWAFQLVAATLVGVVIGALLFKNAASSSANTVQISLSDATFERSHDNLD
jgi:F0F1-type ATP synthase assembly protein I